MRKHWFFVFLHMLKKRGFLFFFLMSLFLKAQEVTVPVDLRQHNLIELNASIFNPVFSFYGNTEQSVSFWTRWQWQQIDADPSTLFLNYSRQLNEESVVGLGFFQHNTGVFQNTGGVLNYAYRYGISDAVNITVGLNLYGFKRKLADARFQLDPDFPFPQLNSSADFILQAAPGILFQIKKFQLGLTSENLFDYNFAQKERQSRPQERIYLISAGYDFNLLSGKSILRPVVYYKAVPFLDDQIGISTIFSNDKYWAQAGYNNFYGVSVGAGGRFFKKLSVGALVEFATDAALDGKEYTFEINTAYHLGPSKEQENTIPKRTKEAIVQTKSKDKKQLRNKRKQEKEARRVEKMQLEAAQLAEQKRQDSIYQAEIISQQQIKNRDSIANLAAKRKQEQEEELAKAAAKAKEKRKTDSLAQLSAERISRREAAIAAQKRLDSINNNLSEESRIESTTPVREKVVLEKNEKYEEVQTEDGLQPGFYLIANVFGTKKYYTKFMSDLSKKGINAKSFLRSKNNYQYVYLKRYDTMREARNARNSKFSGSYADKTWIFRVVGE